MRDIATLFRPPSGLPGFLWAAEDAQTTRASIAITENTMPRSRPSNLPIFDHYGHALRLVKKVREGRTVAQAVGLAPAYARDVRDIECANEAARFVGRSAALIRKHCVVPVAVIRNWRDAAQVFGSGRGFTDRKLANFLAGMYKEVSAAQIAEAVREARAQAAKAKARHDTKKAAQWRRAAANLGAMCQSITEGGFVPVPYPGK
jgi:hypothetical protein